MQYRYDRITDFRPIYELCRGASVPYWFETDYQLWLRSFAQDSDCDGDVMFSELQTYGAYIGDELRGFVQFGISRYIYGEDGGKDFSTEGGVIRQLYFRAEDSCGEGLIALAQRYFDKMQAERRYAFFHAFGMSCYAGHGKLYTPFRHIEEALIAGGFRTEHENVYYKRLLTDSDIFAEGTVTAHLGEVSAAGLREFRILRTGGCVGAGALVYLPQGDIAYLRWIYIEGSEQGKGYAAAALRALFSRLYEEGIRRIDTDTADGNLTAQHLYTKNGFEDMGRTRSYIYGE